MQEIPVWFLSWEGPLRRDDRLSTPVFLGLPGGSDGKESAGTAEDLDSIPGLGRSPGEGNGHPLPYSCLENPMDRGAWRVTVHGVTKSQTQLTNQALTYPQRRPCGDSGRRWPSYISTREGTQEKPALLTPWSRTSNFQKCEAINFGCLSGPACGPLFWQPKQTNTRVEAVGTRRGWWN